MEKSIQLKPAIQKAISYKDYLNLTEVFLSEGKTTGPNQSEDYLHYTNLNFHRMKRLDKTVELNEDLKSLLQAIEKPQTWLVISEAWCGDAAQNVPILQKMAAQNQLIDLKIILRDENLDVMDLYLTKGGRSIPKLIALENETFNEIFTWGPRPAVIQEVMNQLKEENITELSVMVEKIQIAYNYDKSQSIQEEFKAILTSL